MFHFHYKRACGAQTFRVQNCMFYLQLVLHLCWNIQSMHAVLWTDLYVISCLYIQPDF